MYQVIDRTSLPLGATAVPSSSALKTGFLVWPSTWAWWRDDSGVDELKSELMSSPSKAEWPSVVEIMMSALSMPAELMSQTAVYLNGPLVKITLLCPSVSVRRGRSTIVPRDRKKLESLPSRLSESAAYAAVPALPALVAAAALSAFVARSATVARSALPALSAQPALTAEAT